MRFYRNGPIFRKHTYCLGSVVRVTLYQLTAVSQDETPYIVLELSASHII